MNDDQVEHPQYGLGEIVNRYPDGSMLVRFSSLPGGDYKNGHGPVIMAVMYADAIAFAV
jgi:hypothetical protein